MKYLVTTVETWRADTEVEAVQLIEEAKQDKHFILSKYSSQYKERKQKGEVIDSWYQVSLKKVFTDEKEPEFSCSVSYSNEMESAF